MAIKVLHEHLVDAIFVAWIRAGVAHRAAAASQVDPHCHSDLPNAWEGFRWTRCYHALVSQLIVERIGPQWGRILEDWHGGIVGEIGIVEHFEHFVAANL